MACVRIALVLTLLGLPVVQATAQPHPSPTRTELAEGVHLFRTAPYGDVGLDGNAVAILSRDGVLVFDANGTPAAASAVLAEIRKLTDQPVRFLVLSHWHWDHWYGAEVYRDAFPGVQIIAHETARALMMGPAIEFNRPGLERDLPGYVASLEKKGDTERLAAARFFLAQKRAVRHTLPNVTFQRQLDLYFGGRHVQVQHHDRAVTPGDAFLYLPDEKIVVTGDLLVNPISFALSCYPTGWLRTLEHIDALDAVILVPGHGEPLRDKDLLRAHIALFRELLRGGQEARAKGLDADQAREVLMSTPTLQALKSRITHDDPALDDSFRIYLVDWYLHRVFDEVAGPLTDEIAKIPPK